MERGCFTVVKGIFLMAMSQFWKENLEYFKIIMKNSFQFWVYSFLNSKTKVLTRFSVCFWQNFDTLRVKMWCSWLKPFDTIFASSEMGRYRGWFDNNIEGGKNVYSLSPKVFSFFISFIYLFIYLFIYFLFIYIPSMHFALIKPITDGYHILW